MILTEKDFLLEFYKLFLTIILCHLWAPFSRFFSSPFSSQHHSFPIILVIIALSSRPFSRLVISPPSSQHNSFSVLLVIVYLLWAPFWDSSSLLSISLFLSPLSCTPFLVFLFLLIMKKLLSLPLITHITSSFLNFLG